MIYSGNIFTPDFIFKKGYVETANDIITSITYDESVTDDVLIIPGLIDIHLHGAAGYDVCQGTEEALSAINKYEKDHGIVAHCVATMTIADEELETLLKNLYTHNKYFTGIYLEGPFISSEYAGAQKAECIIAPDINLLNKYNDCSGRLIKYVVVAPETASDNFISSAVKNNIRVTVGHSAADYKDASRAFQEGATQVTHLYNAMKDAAKRAPGIPGAAFDCNSYIELITDGVHIDPTILRMTFNTYSADKIILISDSMSATGMNDGEYMLGNQPVTVNGKEARLKDGSLAGSVTNLYDCLVNAINIGVPIEKAIMAATINPARSLGIDDKYGTIEVGKYKPIMLNLGNLD